MSFLHRHHETPEEKFDRTHPYGEADSVDYWIEAMKRAYALGCSQAQAEIDRLAALPALSPPMSWLDFPEWFQETWTHALAPYNDQDEHPHAMPY